MYAIRYKELVKKDEGINNNMAKKRDKKNKLRGKWSRGIIEWSKGGSQDISVFTRNV